MGEVDRDVVARRGEHCAGVEELVVAEHVRPAVGSAHRVEDPADAVADAAGGEHHPALAGIGLDRLSAEAVAVAVAVAVYQLAWAGEGGRDTLGCLITYTTPPLVLSHAASNSARYKEAAASPDPAARGRSFDVDPADVVKAGSAPPYEHR